MADHNWVVDLSRASQECHLCKVSCAYPCFYLQCAICDSECHSTPQLSFPSLQPIPTPTVRFQHDWAVMLSGEQICNVCKLEHACTSFLNYPKCAICTEDCPGTPILGVTAPINFNTKPVAANYWIRGKDDDVCQCTKPVHVRWNGLGWFCDKCNKKSSDQISSYVSPTKECQCGSSAVCSVRHSDYCPLYVKQ